MRPFQEAALAEIETRLRSAGIAIEWHEKIVGPLPALNYSSGDVDLSASFDIGGRPYEIWVFPDGLQLIGPGVDKRLEWQAYPGNPEAQIRQFGEILLLEVGKPISN